MDPLSPEYKAEIARLERALKSPEEAPQDQPKSRWWLWTILAPIIGLVVGIVIAMGLGQRQDDWLGFRAMAPIMFGLLAGCFLSCAFAVVSLEKKEARCTLAFVAAIPSGLFVAFAILGLLGILK